MGTTSARVGATRCDGAVWAGSKVREEVTEEREGPYTHVGSPALPGSARADTAGSIEREVVSGHAYAIPAPQVATGGRCGHDTPATRRRMVFLTHNPGPRRFCAGALDMEVE